MESNRRSPMAALIVICALISACDRVGDEVEAGRVDLHNPRATSFDPSLMPMPSVSSANSRDEFEAILSEVEARGPGMFVELPPPAVLHELELVYFASGRIFELVDDYLAVVEDLGVEHPMAPRLAYLYQRLGQQTRGEQVAEAAVEARPNDPFAWFVYGFAYGQREDPDDETLRKVEQAFSRTLELDPTFSMPGGIEAEQIREQRDALRERLDTDGAPAEADEPEQDEQNVNGGDSE